MSKKITQYTNNVSVNPDNNSLLDLSEKTGTTTYESRKWTLTAFKTWVASGISSVTNLGYTASPTNGIVTSDTGTDATIPLADGTNAGLLKPADFTKLTNTSGVNSGNETTSTIGTLINGSSSATPNDTDLIGVSDSSVLKKLSLSNLKAFLKTYFDTLYVSKVQVPYDIAFACSDETTALTAGTGKITFRVPRAMTITNIRASLTTAQTSGSIFTINVNQNGTSILGTNNNDSSYRRNNYNNIIN
jgi:hypothetical protein